MNLIFKTIALMGAIVVISAVVACGFNLIGAEQTEAVVIGKMFAIGLAMMFPAMLRAIFCEGGNNNVHR